MNDEILERLKGTLIRRREEIHESYVSRENDRRVLREPEVEFEEMAQKKQIADDLDRVGDLESEEVKAIDAALERIAAGTYGSCDSCGKPIALERLEAIPWTTLCIRCAEIQKDRIAAVEGGPEPALAPEVPLEFFGLSADEICEAIYDQLASDGRVELEELDIACEGGTIRLRGFLPTAAKHAILMQVLRDMLGFTDVVDEIIINPIHWQRQDRSQDIDEPEAAIEEHLAPEETGDAYSSRVTGTPMNAPDELLPEK